MRAERTKKLIIEAMLELMSEKPYDKITIGDIADRAMVNRNTFYMYFEDKPALLKQIFTNSIEDLKKEEDKIMDLDIREYSTLVMWYKAFFKHLHKYKTLYKLSMTSFEEAYSYLYQQLHDYHFSTYLNYIKNSPNYAHYTPTQMILRAEYMLGADFEMAHYILVNDEDFMISVDDIVTVVADYNYCFIFPQNDLFLKKAQFFK